MEINVLLFIGITISAIVLGGVGGFLVFRFVLKGKYNEIITAAEKEAEVVNDRCTQLVVSPDRRMNIIT